MSTDVQHVACGIYICAFRISNRSVAFFTPRIKALTHHQSFFQGQVMFSNPHPPQTNFESFIPPFHPAVSLNSTVTQKLSLGFPQCCPEFLLLTGSCCPKPFPLGPFSSPHCAEELVAFLLNSGSEGVAAKTTFLQNRTKLITLMQEGKFVLPAGWKPDPCQLLGFSICYRATSNQWSRPGSWLDIPQAYSLIIFGNVILLDLRASKY